MKKLLTSALLMIIGGFSSITMAENSMAMMESMLAKDSSELELSEYDKINEMMTQQLAQSLNNKDFASALNSAFSMSPDGILSETGESSNIERKVDLSSLIKSMGVEAGASEEMSEMAQMAQTMDSMNKSYAETRQLHPVILQRAGGKVFTLRRVNANDKVQSLGFEDGTALIGSFQKNEQGDEIVRAYDASGGMHTFSNSDEVDAPLYVHAPEEGLITKSIEAYFHAAENDPEFIFKTYDEYKKELLSQNESGQESFVDDRFVISEEACKNARLGCAVVFAVACAEDNGEGGLRGAPEWILLVYTGYDSEKAESLGRKVKISAVDLHEHLSNTADCAAPGDNKFPSEISYVKGGKGVPLLIWDHVEDMYIKHGAPAGEQNKVAITWVELDEGDFGTKLLEKVGETLRESTEEFLDRAIKKAKTKIASKSQELAEKFDKEMKELKEQREEAKKQSKFNAEARKTYIRVSQSLIKEVDKFLEKSASWETEAKEKVADYVSSTAVGFFGKITDMLFGWKDDHVGGFNVVQNSEQPGQSATGNVVSQGKDNVNFGVITEPYYSAKQDPKISTGKNNGFLWLCDTSKTNKDLCLNQVKKLD